MSLAGIRSSRIGSALLLVSLGAVLSVAWAGPAGAGPASITLTGPTGSQLFGDTVVVLANGNFVVTDPGFDSATAADVGAVYLYDGTTNAVISTLTGSSVGDSVGNGGVTLLKNGNFVVGSYSWSNGATSRVGAVTWANGATG